MTSVMVRRPPRRQAPPLPTGEVVLQPPPELPKPTGKTWSRLLMVLPMAAGGAGMGLMMGAGGRTGPLMYLAGGMYGVSILGMIAMMALNQAGPGKREMVQNRRDYLRELSSLRSQLRDTIRRQRQAVYYRHPDPESLWSTVASGRLWERRRADADFAVVRVGVGPQEIATPLVPPAARPVDELEPLCAMALRKFVTTYSVVPDLPVAMALSDFSRVYVRGPDGAVARDLVRAMLAQLVAFHGPDDLLVAVAAADSRRADWEWVKWLPHATHPSRTDAVGPVRLFAPAVTALEAMLDDVLANRPRFDPATARSGGPRVVVVIDGAATAGSDHLMTDGGVAGVTILDLSHPPPRLLDDATVVIDVAADGSSTGTTMESTVPIGRADRLDPAGAEVLARELAPLRLSAASFADQAGQPVATDLGLAELLGIGAADELDLARTWASRPNRDRLRVPLGVGLDGRPVELDLKESAQEGMGPHGLLVGATGSGKSELLRTLVLALAVTHDSEILNFVLVDFKGGATFATLDRLPHTSAVITNLSEELSLVDRMLDAIQGELVRRQELLRRAGNFASQRDYERARAAGVPLQPLPSLLLVVDEFSELLSARPDFTDMFVQIGRVGRSLGIHLLLASQRLDEGRLRGLETHLSYRIALRTFTTMESRAVLGAPDAYELPRSPGHGYLKAGTEGLVRLKAAYVSGPHRRDEAAAPAARGRGEPVWDFTTYYAATEQDPAPAPEAPEPVPDPAEPGAVTETLLDVLVRRLEGGGTPAHQVWLPPLAEAPTLDQLLPQWAQLPGRGLTVSDPSLHGALRAVVGVVDKPAEQRRDPMWLDLSGAAGHVMVVGGPVTGKSTLLRTLVCGLALTHSPAEVQFYCLDFGGGGLAALAGLPHVGGVATRRDVERVRRTVAELYSLLQLRDDLFSRLGVDGIAGYRRSRQQAEPEDPYGDVFLVVDGWATVRSEFEDLEPLISELANRGLGYGIHIVAAANRWMDVRAAVRDRFGTKVELRLGDPSDSVIGRRAAANVPEHAPGRGLTADGLHFLTGLPRFDGQPRVDDLASALSGFVKEVQAAWSGPPAPPVRLLPKELAYLTLPAPVESRIPIGVAETDLQPVYLDFATEPHLLLLGDVESGKSTFLRTLARSVTRAYPPERARLILVDLRRSLLGCVDTAHLIGTGTSPQVVADLVGQVATVMAERLPGPDVTPEQLRNRSWWTGPELYLLVDDYDLVAGGMANPLSPLLEFLPQGRDVGLHLVLTRRIGGAARAMFDPMISRVRELASPGIMMSGPREEGPLLGNLRPQPLPPGRGWLVTRRHGARLVQLPWLPPER